MSKFLKLMRNRKGATAVEYGLILALICLGMLAALRSLGSVTTGMWTHVANEVTRS